MRTVTKLMILNKSFFYKYLTCTTQNPCSVFLKRLIVTHMCVYNKSMYIYINIYVQCVPFCSIPPFPSPKWWFSLWFPFEAQADLHGSCCRLWFPEPSNPRRRVQRHRLSLGEPRLRRGVDVPHLGGAPRGHLPLTCEPGILLEVVFRVWLGSLFFGCRVLGFLVWGRSLGLVGIAIFGEEVVGRGWDRNCGDVDRFNCKVVGLIV